MPTISIAEIEIRLAELSKLLDPCQLCPRQCLSHRRQGAFGFCRLGDQPLFSSAVAHFGEEPPITGRHGSGTIFLSGCNAACLFCQNYQISHLHYGEVVTPTRLADEFLALQASGCANINWVTPDPQLPFLISALVIAMQKGFNRPVVYNTNGYVRREVLQILEGIVDIYLPDMKYAADCWAEEYSNLPRYSAINLEAIREMYRQVGPLQVDEQGIARRGLLIRHLVLPEDRAGSAKIFRSIAAIDPEIPVSIMAQYHPCYHASGHPVLGRRVTIREYQKAIAAFEEAGLSNAYTQPLEELVAQDLLFPDFSAKPDKIFNQKDNRAKP